jgi:M6 family metalloprotease-like protein
MFRGTRHSAKLLFLIAFLFSLYMPLFPLAALADQGTASGSKPLETKNVRIIVILDEFPDSLHKVSRDVIQKRIFTEVSDYYKETSYGLVNITGDVVPNWIMMRDPISSYGDFTKLIGSDVLDREFKLAFDLVKAADDQVDFKKYDKVVIIIPQVIRVNFSLMQPIKTNDCDISFVTVQREDSPATIIAHELGHSLGLPDLYDHSMAQDGGSTAAGAIYLGSWCLMSNAVGEQFGGFSKVELGWIPEEQIAKMASGSKQVVSLAPLEVKTDGIQIIRIAKAGEAGITRYYLVEARRKIGSDKSLPDEGILITSVDEEKAIRGWSISVKINGPPGFVKLMKPDPDSNGLNHATFNLGQGKKNIFTDASQNLAVVILSSDPKGYGVLITALQDADKTAEYAQKLYQAGTGIDAIHSDNISSETRSILAQARSQYDLCLKSLKAQDPVLDAQGLDKIAQLVDQAIAANKRYDEAAAVMETASLSIQNAEKDGRTGGLEQAKAHLMQARAALDTNNYDKAVVTAVQGRKLADNASTFPASLINTVMGIFKKTDPAGAQFEIISMDLMPERATVGQAVTVTARVANMGNVAGTYPAVLSVNGNEAAKDNRPVAAGGLDTITMKFVPAGDGSHVIDLGGLQKNLVVKKIIKKEIELKYDTDKSRSTLSYWGGHILDFSPPATPMTVKQVKIFGRLSLKLPGFENNPFDLLILDKNLKVVYTSTYAYNKFSDPAAWVNFDVPDIQVNDKFYICVFTKSTSGAISVGVDDGPLNEHSDLAFRDTSGNILILTPWPTSQEWYGDRSKVNWMIRVVGTADLPED